MKRLAIIPARGGSKRIPEKNIRNFFGRPMIEYSIDAAKKSGLFETIHVSTDSLRIAAVVENAGLRVDFMRPAELADDNTPIMPVLKYVLEEYKRRGSEFDLVCMIMACAPLIGPEDLLGAERLFGEAGCARQVLAIAPFPVPIEWAFSRASDGSLLPENPGAFATPSQELTVKYYDAGAFSFLSVDSIMASEGAGSDAGFMGYVLSQHKVVDIDDEDDWQLAETLYACAHHESRREDDD